MVQMAELRDFEMEYLKNKDMGYFVPELGDAEWKQKAYVCDGIEETRTLLAGMDLEYTSNSQR